MGELFIEYRAKLVPLGLVCFEVRDRESPGDDPQPGNTHRVTTAQPGRAVPSIAKLVTEKEFFME